ncbi:hypothetical protein HHI36_002558 [Cryptolaemus montrouzieri]|uniref:Claspin n=1 Tax=Cryptolaemus montrouzieri TaxID=559131 RepID=A0ABD2PAV6_9CUCU
MDTSEIESNETETLEEKNTNENLLEETENTVNLYNSVESQLLKQNRSIQVNEMDDQIEAYNQQTKLEKSNVDRSLEEVSHFDDTAKMDSIKYDKNAGNQVGITEIDEIKLNDTEQLQKNDSGESKDTGKLIILSDVVVNLAEPSTSKHMYSLDDELSQLASESNKDFCDYDFNLDDIEDDSQGAVMENKIVSCEGKEINENNTKKQRKMEMIQKLGELKPRLSGGPNEIIDLASGMSMPDEVFKLRERFLQHTFKPGKNKNKKEVSILSVCDGKIQKETLALSVEEVDEESTAPLEKPGVRLQKLREELQHQIAQRRSELWKEKQSNKSESNQEDRQEDDKSDYEIDNILDDDEEEEITDSEEEDEDLEENDCDMSEKKETKSAFVEDEAEESDREDEDENIAFNEDEIENEDDIEETNEEPEENTNTVEEEKETENSPDEESSKKKVLKRIIKAFDNDDSDDDEVMNQKNSMFELMLSKKERPISDDNFVLPQQPLNYKTIEPVVTPNKSDEDFLTPVTYMTGIRNLNDSGSRIIAEIPLDKNKSFTSHKKLFDEETGLNSQTSDLPTQEISDKCMQKENTQENTPVSLANESSSQPNGISTQDVLEICSGSFPCTSKSVSSPEISTQQLKEIFGDESNNVNKSNRDFNTQDLADICSGQFTGISPAVKQNEKETVLDEKDEHLISQLIDEEELERFKKRFESPLASNTQKTINFELAEEVQGTGGVIDSDDEDNELKLKKKKRKKLAFSDDEESSDNELGGDEEIDLQDDEDLASNVEYDSEENEIDAEEYKVDHEERMRERMKATEFFEKEAELSESEWGSEDEDERNLDDMEFEKGDEEKFDEDELRSDIERVQMKQMLDEDNREVKLLQELLLEDGELHGSGRQRQFKWKNIDDAGNEIEDKKDDDGDVYLDEDESEEQWRKMRHEREMFMLKRQSQGVDEECLIESQKLSFTHKSLKIKSQSSILSQSLSVEVESTQKIKQPFTLLNKRGSFLSRSEQILQKFAEASKISLGTKNSNRIVFQAVDEEMKKRKAPSELESDSTPVALKKMRLTGLSPAMQKTKPKAGKSLFKNLID